MNPYIVAAVARTDARRRRHDFLPMRSIRFAFTTGRRDRSIKAAARSSRERRAWRVRVHATSPTRTHLAYERGQLQCRCGVTLTEQRKGWLCARSDLECEVLYEVGHWSLMPHI